jgi:hypothetical protein
MYEWSKVAPRPTLRNPSKPKLVYVTFNNSVRTAKKTVHFTVTKINWLTLFKVIIAVYSQNHTKHTNTNWRVDDSWRRWNIELPLGFDGVYNHMIREPPSTNRKRLILCSCYFALGPNAFGSRLKLYLISSETCHQIVTTCACIFHFFFFKSG